MTRATLLPLFTLLLIISLASGCSKTSTPTDNGSNNNNNGADVGPGPNATWDTQFSNPSGGPAGKLLDGPVNRLLVYNNKLYGVGGFTYVTSSTNPLVDIFVWNGSTIDSTGVAIPVQAFDRAEGINDAIVVNNKIFANGSFQGGDHMMWFDGSSWQIETGEPIQYPHRLAINGSDVFDYDTEPDGAKFEDSTHLYKWDGTKFGPFTGFGAHGTTREVVGAVVSMNGTLYVATNETGSFVFDPQTWIYKFDGTKFVETGSWVGETMQLTTNGSKLYAIGEYFPSKGSYNVASYDGTTWTSDYQSDLQITGSNIPNVCKAACADKNGNVYVASQTDLWKWDGTTAKNLGKITGGSVQTMIVFGDKLFVGGSFYSLGGVSSYNLGVLR